MTRLLAPLVLTVALLVAGCGQDAPEADSDRLVLTPLPEAEGHSHAPGETDAGPAGDGTRAQAGGHRLVDVSLPTDVATPGEVRFRILDAAGDPVTDYVEEQTKLLHLYVVRDDLTHFRHLHPTLARDGTWSARVSLGAPGDYRVVAEFHPVGAERAIVLAEQVTVPGDWTPVDVPTGPEAATGTDGVLSVSLDGATTGPDEQMTARVTGVDEEPVTLGTYLGAYAHVSGFEVSTGRFVHTHPLGAPEETDDGTVLTFHTSFADPGDYRFFVQVRVEGFVHQVPVTTAVSDGA